MIIKTDKFPNQEFFVEGNAYNGFYIIVEGKKHSLPTLDAKVVKSPQKRLFAYKMYLRAGSKNTELASNLSLDEAIAETFEIYGSEESEPSHSILAVFNENRDLLARKFAGKPWEVFN
ncbi:hypothetical protein VCHA53O466_140035 [Vibrio chagasii]|nr:hypothetical protein VCHA53O466_140035 [Vibrio chagasii]